MDNAKNAKTELTREQAVKQLSRATVVGVGTTKNVQIAWINSFVDEEGKTRHIATLNAIGKTELEKAKELFAEGRFTEATNLRLTYNLFDNNVDDFAIGQLVEVQCQMVDVTSEDTKALLGNSKLGVSAIIRAKAVEGFKDSFFSDLLKEDKEAMKTPQSQEAPVENFDE